MHMEDYQTEYFCSYREVVRLASELKKLYGYDSREPNSIVTLYSMKQRKFSDPRLDTVMDRYLIAKEKMQINRERNYLFQ